eukprot:15361505-Ditylum_brightwellii.AAC.1
MGVWECGRYIKRRKSMGVAMQTFNTPFPDGMERVLTGGAYLKLHLTKCYGTHSNAIRIRAIPYSQPALLMCLWKEKISMERSNFNISCCQPKLGLVQEIQLCPGPPSWPPTY